MDFRLVFILAASLALAALQTFIIFNLHENIRVIKILRLDDSSVAEDKLANNSGNSPHEPSKCGQFEWPTSKLNENRSATDQLIASKRIGHGQQAQLKQFPSFVWINCRDREGFQRYCGGALVASDRVATAGHCIQFDNKCSVVAGFVCEDEVSKSFASIFGFGSKIGDEIQRAEVQQFCYHNRFRGASHGDDLAILKLDRNLTINDYVRPICLAPAEEATPTEDEILYAVGFGRINEKPEVSKHLNYMPVLRSQCTSSQIDSNSCYKSISRGEVCPGDSGTGLYLIRNGRQYLAGLASLKETDDKASNRLCFSDRHESAQFFDVFKQRSEFTKLLQKC